MEEIDESVEQEEPVWKVHVKYRNDEVQDTKSSYEVGDHVDDLVLELMAYFDEEDEYEY